MTNTAVLREARRYPIGAETIASGVSFRVWAPARASISIVLADGSEHAMNAEDGGYFSCEIAGLTAGALYRFRVATVEEPAADPASRFQPTGPAGWSMVVDPGTFRWRDTDWRGVMAERQVLYEMHFGTFTPEGTYAAAAKKLPLLKEIGITCLEVMPVNEFCGEFGWGYDGVLPYAPTRLYGWPDDLRAFIDGAHTLGIGVILDVVYNHLGTTHRFDDFTPEYFTDRYANDWGRSFNFDGDNCHGVREFLSKNAAYWIDEYHFDGLRLDATQAMFDAGDDHIVNLVVREARAAAGSRSIYIVGENEPQETRFVRSRAQSGHGLDAVWNDDFHHSAMVALTGRNEAYYHDHRGTAQEFVSAGKYGYLFQGQRYDWQDAPRGRAGFDLGPQNFVHFVQNHDQIANSGTGARIDRLAAPARIRAMTALLLIGPQTPMLFQGQEFGASNPFFYFADLTDGQAEIVRKGRLDFLKQFPSLQDEAFARCMADPSARSTFERSKLDWTESADHQEIVRLHTDLLKLRCDMPTLSARPNVQARLLDGSVIGKEAFLLRFFASMPEDERLVIVNFGTDIEIAGLADPLLAPPDEHQWGVIWSSEDFAYGGSGRRPADLQSRWTLGADCALILTPVKAKRRATPGSDYLREWQTRIST